MFILFSLLFYVYLNSLLIMIFLLLFNIGLKKNIVIIICLFDFFIICVIYFELTCFNHSPKYGIMKLKNI